MTSARGVFQDRNAAILYPLIAAVAFITLLVLARDMGFRGDDWDLIVNRSLVNPATWMTPFNEQWVAVPAVIFQAIFTVVGMHSYVPYLAVLLLLHLLVAEGIRRLVTRMSGRTAGFLAGIVVLFLGVGSENLTWAFQIGMVLATAAGLWAVEALAFRRWPELAALLLTFAVASHAIGAVFVVICLIVAVSLRLGRTAIGWLLVPAAALLAWLVVYGLPVLAARGGSFTQAIPAIPSFVGAGIASAAGGVFGLGILAGAALLAVLVLAAWRFQRRPAWPAIAAGALVGLISEYLLIAISRGQFGLVAAGWSRYLYVAVPLMLVMASAWFGTQPSLPARWRPTGTVALAALTAVAIVGNLRYDVLNRDLQLEHVHRARAAAAIVTWAADLSAWDQDLELPTPVVLRDLIVAHGSPARDDFLPGLVPHVPADLAHETCVQLVPLRPIGDCLAAVRDGVGAN